MKRLQTENENGSLNIIDIESESIDIKNDRFFIYGRVVPNGERDSSFYQIIKLEVIPSTGKTSVWSSSCLDSSIVMEQLTCLSEVKEITAELLNNPSYFNHLEEV